MIQRAKDRFRTFCRELLIGATGLSIVLGVVGTAGYSLSRQNAMDVARTSDKSSLMANAAEEDPKTSDHHDNTSDFVEISDNDIKPDQGSQSAPVIHLPSQVSLAPERERIAENEARKQRSPKTLEAQISLARTYEEQGLIDLAKEHWEAILGSNPKNKIALAHLGYKLRNGRWMTDAMFAEHVELKALKAKYKKQFAILHKKLHQRSQQSEAIAECATIDDPLAVSAMWEALGGHHRHHLILTQILERIESREGSRILAALAVYSRDEKAKALAFQTLQRRDPLEFADALIALLCKRLEYRVITLSGESQSKSLLIEDERIKREFAYLVPSAQELATASAFGSCSVSSLLSGPVPLQAHHEQASAAADAAGLQIQSDIAIIESINQSITQLNGRVVEILNTVTRQRLGEDREDWRKWLAAELGVPYSPLEFGQKFTISEVVAPIYQPTFITIPAPS